MNAHAIMHDKWTRQSYKTDMGYTQRATWTKSYFGIAINEFGAHALTHLPTGKRVPTGTDNTGHSRGDLKDLADLLTGILPESADINLSDETVAKAKGITKKWRVERGLW